MEIEILRLINNLMSANLYKCVRKGAAVQHIYIM